MNQLNVSLQHSIATLAAKGWSARKIARELGLHRETVGRHLRLADPDSKPAIPPPGSKEGPDSKTAIVPAGSKAGRTSQCAPLAEVVEAAVLAGLSAQRIYQDLVIGHQFTGGYDSVKRFVRRLARKVEPPFRRMRSRTHAHPDEVTLRGLISPRRFPSYPHSRAGRPGPGQEIRL